MDSWIRVSRYLVLQSDRLERLRDYPLVKDRIHQSRSICAWFLERLRDWQSRGEPDALFRVPAEGDRRRVESWRLKFLRFPGFFRRVESGGLKFLGFPGTVDLIDTGGGGGGKVGG